jgi:hypothetical protein
VSPPTTKDTGAGFLRENDRLFAIRGWSSINREVPHIGNSFGTVIGQVSGALLTGSFMASNLADLFW